MDSLLNHFYPWTPKDDLPGVHGLMLPHHLGRPLHSLHEAMLMAGYQKHEILYIQDYVQVTGVLEQDAVLHLGIGGHDRIAAALALWKGYPWLPLQAAKNMDIRYLRPYAAPRQVGDNHVRSVPIAASPKGLMYGISMLDDFQLQNIQTHLLGLASGRTEKAMRALNGMSGLNGLPLREILRRLDIIPEEDVRYLEKLQSRIRAAEGDADLANLIFDEGSLPPTVLGKILQTLGHEWPDGLSEDPFVRAPGAAHMLPDIHLAITSTGTVESLFQRGIKNTERDFEKACKIESEDRFNEMINRLLIHSAYQGYSDIHLSPVQMAGIVERRKDGIKGLVKTFPIEEYTRMVGVIMNRMGNVDTRLQAEGRIPAEQLPPELAGRFEFRIQYMSVVQGGGDTGSLTLRVMNLMNETAVLETLGFTDADLGYIRKVLRTGKGLVLATGPTGSGKTTTLYAMMRAIDAIQTSVQSVENPVEIRVGLWRQHQLLREKAEHVEWLDWNKGLLRNDPDVVLQGEVRTADLFEQVADMANTGHLVFTTFHASSAALAIGRLRQMRTSHGDPLDIDMIASLMHCIIAQGLARKLCPHCSVADDRPETKAFLSPLPEHQKNAATPKMASDMGCNHCADSGYAGRFLVYEILKFTRTMRDKIIAGATLAEIEMEIQDTETMMGKLRRHVAMGETSLEEAYRLSGEVIG